ncbi:MAG TPA: M1 family aminopeptidase, partial [Chitinophagaceae bacterium]|nr:M1 family aminopeptidase [Chitinophagaceae bacterium]
ETKAVQKTDQPIALPSEQFEYTNYALSSYYKTAEWLRLLESHIGEAGFKQAMQEYYRRWQFRHPRPSDLQNVLEESSGKDLDSVFSWLNKKGLLPNQTRSGTTTAFIFDKKSLEQYARQPSKNLLLFGPAIGMNAYDKLMLGGFFTNLKLPPSRFQFLAIPFYATGSKNFTGLGFFSHHFYPDQTFRKIEWGLSAARFTADQFTDPEEKTISMSFQKIVPGIRFTLKEKNPRSSIHRFIQFKSFLVSEERLRFSRDSIITPGDTTIIENYGTQSQNRDLQQLQFVVENNRALYPYRGELKIEQAKDFIRAAFTGKYFFNYPKEGGLDLRLFAGKFIYSSTKTTAKQFATDRYHLNMTGANGYEDYTYSDYFIGRNKFEGLLSQQIMVRDGAFKVRTDLLAEKTGRSDDWLIAANFSTTIPSGLNPLSMLPVKIPLKIFLDIGTHAEAWKEDAEGDRFLFDAGLQLSLFKETVNIYLPLLYSRVFKDYIQSTLEKKGRLWKTVSFSIDISNFSFRKIDRNLDF